MSKQSAICPRCGYDLSGTVATWTQQCPLSGRCNECGLELDWPRVFVLTEHPWLFEYHWKRKPFSRFFKTILIAFQPRRFWREVKLTDPVHLVPAAFVVAALLFFTLVILIAEIVNLKYQANANWIQTSPMSSQQLNWSFGISDVVGRFNRMLRINLKSMPGLPAALFAMPVIFSLIPTTLRKARVKSSHILRIFFYSLTAPIAIACLWCALLITLRESGFYSASRTISPRHWSHLHSTSVIGSFVYQLLPGMALAIPCSIWMAYWWHQACKQYLKLKETRSITILLSLILFLFVTVIEMVLTKVIA